MEPYSRELSIDMRTPMYGMYTLHAYITYEYKYEYKYTWSEYEYKYSTLKYKYKYLRLKYK